MDRVFLISEDTLKEEVLNDNVAPEYIEQATDLAQNIGLHQIIGTKLLNKLTSLVATGDISKDENSTYKELLNNYITDYLKWQVMSELTLLLGYKYRNAGVVNTGDEHAKDTSMADAQYMKNYYSDKASFFAITITNYLKNNASKIPEYTCGKSCNEIGSSELGFDTGIYLG